MNRRVDLPSRRQVRRIAAWIYAVMNPILTSLERELGLMGSGNLTWRALTSRCELIRTIPEYIEATQLPNYQTFVAEHRNSLFMSGFKQHDTRVLGLDTTAHLMFKDLLSNSEFLAAVNDLLGAYENKKESLGPSAPALTHTRGKIPEMAAEYLINNVQTLPDHYLISAFWNSTGRNLLAFRTRPEFGSLHRSIERLSGVSEKLRVVLEDYRLELSRAYDVPAAPVTGISFEE